MALALIQPAMRIAALLLVLAMGLVPVHRAAAAGARAHHQIGGQPVTPCLDAGTRSNASPIAWRTAGSPTAATAAIGPPAYLGYRRLLL